MIHHVSPERLVSGRAQPIAIAVVGSGDLVAGEGRRAAHGGAVLDVAVPRAALRDEPGATAGTATFTVQRGPASKVTVRDS